MTTKGTAPFFTGKYAREFARVLVASAISGEHFMSIGGPGTGKTDISMAVARRIYGAAFNFTRLDSTTPPEKIQGLPDMAAAMATPPQIVIHTDKTIYDPQNVSGILDELGRAGDYVFDILLDVYDRKDIPRSQRITIWSTSNFVPPHERVQALVDRISLWSWIDAGEVDIQAFVNARLEMTDSLDVDLEMPTLDEIAVVRSYRAGNDAKQAVAHTIQALVNACADAAKDGGRFTFIPNMRRLAAWTNLLYRVSAYFYGTPDFKTVHPEAMAMLQYAWPSITVEEFNEWKHIALSVQDILALAIAQIQQDAYGKMLEKARELRSGGKTLQVAHEVGTLMSMYLEELHNKAEDAGTPDDPRVQEVSFQLADYLSKLIQGKEEA